MHMEELGTDDACGLMTPDVYGKVFGPGKVLFVRHGEKTGHSRDADLTESGRASATGAGTCFPNGPDLFLSSPAVRAVHTAECMREGMGSDADMVVLDCLRGIPVRDKEGWKDLKRSAGRLEALTMWRDGQVSEEILPPFREAASALLSDILSAVPEGCSAVAGTHDHVIRFIALAMGHGLGGEIGYLEGIMFGRGEMESRLDALREPTPHPSE